MIAFPHHYTVTVTGNPTGTLHTRGDNTPSLEVAPPRQFDGPGDLWSPEELLMAAVADCLVLSFRAIARASKLEWQSIHCESRGVLDKEDRVIRFTAIETTVQLTIAENVSAETAEKLLHKAEQSCLVSNSLSCKNTLVCSIVTE